MLRKLIDRFNTSLSERLVAARRRASVPVRVWFEPDINSQHLREVARNNALVGETVDLSRTGVAFMVGAIRLKEKYLVGQDRKLNVEIDLPTGKVEMQVIGKRYESVGIHLSTEKFLVGAHIIKIDPESNAAYDHFLRFGSRRKRGAAGSLELNTDRSG